MTVSDKYGTYLTEKECKFVHAVMTACKDMPSAYGDSAIHEAMSSWDMGTHQLFSLMERLEKCEHITDIISVPASGLMIESKQEHPLIRKHSDLTHEIDSDSVSGADISVRGLVHRSCDRCNRDIEVGDTFYYWVHETEDMAFCHPSCVEMYYLLKKHASLTHEIDSERVSFSETCTHCDSHIDDGDKFYFWEQKDDRGIPKIPNEDGVFCHPSCVEMYYMLTWLKEGEPK